MDFETSQHIMLEANALASVYPDLRTSQEPIYEEDETSFTIFLWDKDREMFIHEIKSIEEWDVAKRQIVTAYEGLNNLTKIQNEIGQWSQENFGEGSGLLRVLGLCEEVGELSHHVLKREQGIRGTAEEHKEGMIDAVGDIMIYLMDFCYRENIDLFSVTDETWNKIVKKRNWKKNSETGKV